jgi:hypothetical protein
MLEATNLEARLNDSSEREKSTTPVVTFAVTRPFRGRQRVASLCQLSLASPRL